MKSTSGPIVFIHIPKTGGSSLHDLLIRSLPGLSFCPARFYPELHKYAPEELTNFDLFSGHFGVRDCVNIKNPKYVTIIRNPIDRVVSLYTYWKAQQGTYTGTPESDPFNAGVEWAIRSKSIDEFLDTDNQAILATFSNTQCRFISSSPSKDKAMSELSTLYHLNKALWQLRRNFAWYGTIDSLDEQLPVFWQRLSVEPGKILKLPVRNRTPSKYRKVELSEATIERIKSLNISDMALYDYVTRNPIKEHSLSEALKSFRFVSSAIG